MTQNDIHSIFSRVYLLAREGKHLEVINELIHSGKIQKPYTIETNHAWFCAGAAYSKLGEFDKALQAFKSAYKLWDEDVDAIIEIGRCYLELNNLRWAKYYLEKALSFKNLKKSRRSRTLYNLGNVYYDLGDYIQAIKLFKNVSKKDEYVYSLAQKNIVHAKNKMKISKGRKT